MTLKVIAFPIHPNPGTHLAQKFGFEKKKKKKFKASIKKTKAMIKIIAMVIVKQ